MSSSTQSDMYVEVQMVVGTLILLIILITVAPRVLLILVIPALEAPS